MKKLASLFLVLAMILSISNPAFAEDEKESTVLDTEDETAGELLYNLGIITGTDGGQLDEEKTITRQEMVSILVRLVDVDQKTSDFVVPTTPSFEDVPVSNWAYRDIEYAYSMGLTAGIGDNKFGLNQNISNNQATLFLLRSLGYETGDIDYKEAAKEIAEKYDFKLEIEEDGSKLLERGQIFELMSKALNMNEYETDQKKIYKLGYDEDKTANFINGFTHSKNYKTGNAEDLSTLDKDEEQDEDQEQESEEDNKISEEVAKDFPVVETEITEEIIDGIAGDDENYHNLLMKHIEYIESEKNFISSYLTGEYTEVEYNDFLELVKPLYIGFTDVRIEELSPEYVGEGESPYDCSKSKFTYNFDTDIENTYDIRIESEMGYMNNTGKIEEIRKYSDADGSSVYAVITSYIANRYNSETDAMEESERIGYVAFRIKENMAAESIGSDNYGSGYSQVYWLN